MPRRFAAADIGSNTVHLLVGEMTGRGGIRRVVNISEWLSLGEIVSKEGKIPSLDTAKLLETLRRYKRISDDAGVESLYVFATEAMRVAENHTKLIDEIRKQTGIKVDLISPRREAELSLLGVTIDTQISDSTIFVEVGGGSAQVALCEGHDIVEQASLPIGTGKLLGTFGLNQPASETHIEEMRHSIFEQWDSAPKPREGAVAVASGGVARGIMRALHPDGERIIQLYELEYLMRAVAGLEIGEIVRRFRVKEKRAGSLLPGSMIFIEMLHRYGQDRILVSEFGVREGAILELSLGGNQ